MIGALIMVKNEEESISVTLNSIKDHVKHVILVDTGSTDQTINVVKKHVKKNKQVLHLHKTIFTNFAVTRNECIDFAESIAPSIGLKYLLLLDSGDEFVCKIRKLDLYQLLNNLDDTKWFGVVTKKWKAINGMIDHYDVRFIRCYKKCRYDIQYPVHESFAITTYDQLFLLGDTFTLFQDRTKYGEASNARFTKDIEMLLKAPKNNRNCYYLAKSYLDALDYENAYKYFVEALENTESKLQNIMYAIDDYTIIMYILNCLSELNQPDDTVLNYIYRAINKNKEAIDAYLFLFKYCIDHNCIEHSLPYLQIVSEMNKPTHITTMTVNHNYYDCLRWQLLTQIYLKTKQYTLGKEACKKVLLAQNNSIDQINLQVLTNLEAEENNQLQLDEERDNCDQDTIINI